MSGGALDGAQSIAPVDRCEVSQCRAGGRRITCGGEQVELSPHDRGKKVFTANCQTCHQANGLGVPGQYPPLAGSEFTTGGSRRMAMIVLKGLQGPVEVKGQQYGTAVMQPWDKTLTDKQIGEVMS